MKLTGFVALCAVVLFAACNKSEDPKDDTKPGDTPGKSAKRQLLEAGKWQLTAEIATANYMGKDTTVDLYADMEECDKDDFVVFAGDGTVTVDENADKCDDDNQLETFTWALLDNDTRIALVDSNPDTFDIIELTATQWKFKKTEANSSGVPVNWISTYKNIK